MLPSRIAFSSRLNFRNVVRCVLVSLLSLAASLSLLPSARAASDTGFVQRVYKDDKGEHKYMVFVPRNYTPQNKLPAVLFLHGAGERGKDARLASGIGLGDAIRARSETFPILAIFPQCEDTRGRILTAWSPGSPDGKRALKILEQVEREYSVDPRQIVIAGWSMGGFGAIQIAAANPTRFSGLIALSAGADAALAAPLKNMPVWMFHGARDAIVRPDESRKFHRALQGAGSRAWFTELRDADHNIWETVFTEDAFLRWVTAPTNDGKMPAVVRSQKHHGTSTAGAQPFVPALDIPHALYVRMGNDMLAALADAVPRVVSPDALSGRLNDINDYTNSSGYSFNVNFTNLTYSAQLTRAVVKAYAPDRLNVQLGVSNLRIEIGATYVNGSSKSAVAGPITILIGHMRPVWISFDVTPYVENRKLKLRFVGGNFRIPDDNWYVTEPAGVDTHGWFMTERKVTNGLVSGLYGAKYRIEEQVNSVIPTLLTQIEQRLDLSQADKAVANIWPLPVYRPRLRTWADEVVTDAKGVTVALGVTVAAFDPKIQNKWTMIKPVAPGAAWIPANSQFQFGVAPQILGPLSKMLAQVDATHIHVLDTPSKSLARFVDRGLMTEIIPDLQRYGDKLELWAELALNSPLQVADGSGRPAIGAQVVTVKSGEDKPVTSAKPEGTPPPLDKKQTADPPAKPDNVDSLTAGPKKFALVVPRLSLIVSYKTDPASATFTPCAEFDLTVKQNAWPQLERPTTISRSLSLMLEDQVQLQVTGRFAKGYQAENQTLNTDRMASVFREGWREFTHGGPADATRLPDIDLGYTKLRAAVVEWTNPFLATTYGPAGVKLTNSSKVPLVYETKGPHSDWGGPCTLPPGKSHEYDIAYPLMFRRQSTGGAHEAYTLPAGSHSEFFVSSTGGPPRLYQARERPPLAPPVPASTPDRKSPAASVSARPDNQGAKQEPATAGP